MSTRRRYRKMNLGGTLNDVHTRLKNLETSPTRYLINETDYTFEGPTGPTGPQGATGPAAVVVYTSGTRPSGSAGQIIYETDTKRVLVYESGGGGGWVVLSEPMQTYTVATTNITGNGSVSGKYQRNNGWCDATILFTYGNTSSFTGVPTFSLPFERESGNVHTTSANLTAVVSGTSAIFPGIADVDTTVVRALAPKVNGARVETEIMTTTVPFTFATSDTIRIVLRYPLATRTSF